MTDVLHTPRRAQPRVSNSTWTILSIVMFAVLMSIAIAMLAISIANSGIARLFT